MHSPGVYAIRFRRAVSECCIIKDSGNASQRTQVRMPCIRGLSREGASGELLGGLHCELVAQSSIMPLSLIVKPSTRKRACYLYQ